MTHKQSVDERILTLEAALVASQQVRPNELGTTLQRYEDLSKPSRRELKWALGIGSIGQTRRWFHGTTIDQVLSQAEQYVQSL